MGSLCPGFEFWPLTPLGRMTLDKAPLISHIQDGGEYSILPWIKWNEQRESPSLCKHVPNGGPQGPQEALSQELGFWSGQACQSGQRNDAKPPCCQQMRLPRMYHHLAMRCIVSSLPCANQGSLADVPHRLLTFLLLSAYHNIYQPVGSLLSLFGLKPCFFRPLEPSIVSSKCLNK